MSNFVRTGSAHGTVDNDQDDSRRSENLPPLKCKLSVDQIDAMLANASTTRTARVVEQPESSQHGINTKLTATVLAATSLMELQRTQTTTSAALSHRTRATTYARAAPSEDTQDNAEATDVQKSVPTSLYKQNWEDLDT